MLQPAYRTGRHLGQEVCLLGDLSSTRARCVALVGLPVENVAGTPRKLIDSRDCCDYCGDAHFPYPLTRLVGGISVSREA